MEIKHLARVASLLLSSLVAIAAANEEDSVFLWSSTGGGWRAMCACFGFASAFQKAGLFTKDSSKFRSIATNSGASWFNTQLFYSQAFYDQVVMAPTPEHLYNFTIAWIDTYYELTSDSKSYMEDNITVELGNLSNTSSSLLIEDLVDEPQYTLEEDLGVNFSNVIPPEGSDVHDEFDPLAALAEFYDLYRSVNASWGSFIWDMMTRATVAYGHNGDFASIVANAENRLPALQQTEMILQTTLSPSSKVRLASADYNHTDTATNYGDSNLTDEWAHLAPLFGQLEIQDMAVFLGPLPNGTIVDGSIQDWDIYSVGLSAYFLVNDTFAGIQHATHDSASTSTMAAYCSPTHQHFDWAHFRGWFLFPNEGFWGQPTDPPLSIMSANIPATYNRMYQNMTSTGTFREPFGGSANVIQAAAVSSAFAGPASPVAPPIFAQALSGIRQQVIESLGVRDAILALTAFDLTVQQLYRNAFLDNGAVCSQWPDPCGPADGYYMDGAFSDNPSVVSNVIQYQNSADADLSKAIKLVMTNTNQNFTYGSLDTAQLLQYFDCDLNQDTPPGGYLWLSGFPSPNRSPQIFKEYLSELDIAAATQPIEGSNMTTAIFKGTTIVNPAFGSKAGQAVEIMMINTNEPIPTFIAGLQLIEHYTIPMADMTVKISSNEILIRRIREFFFGDEVVEADISRRGTAPSSSGANRQRGL